MIMCTCGNFLSTIGNIMTYLPRVKKKINLHKHTLGNFTHIWEFIMVKSKNILKAKKLNILALLVWFFIRIFSNPIILFIYLML